MLRKKYKVDLITLPNKKVKVTYTLKNHVQFYEVISTEEAYYTKRLYYKKSELKISNKVDHSVKVLLRYGYLLYKLYGKDIAMKKLSDFVNLNII
jgi:hypothetical protein